MCPTGPRPRSGLPETSEPAGAPVMRLLDCGRLLHNKGGRFFAACSLFRKRAYMAPGMQAASQLARAIHLTSCEIQQPRTVHFQKPGKVRRLQRVVLRLTRHSPRGPWYEGSAGKSGKGDNLQNASNATPGKRHVGIAPQCSWGLPQRCGTFLSSLGTRRERHRTWTFRPTASREFEGKISKRTMVWRSSRV